MTLRSADAPPQQELPAPDWTRSAACPYFSRTTSLMVCVLIAMSFQQQETIACGSMALFRVQHSAYRKPRSS